MTTLTHTCTGCLRSLDPDELAEHGHVCDGWWDDHGVYDELPAIAVEEDTCPEWQCPDLSSEDRREGRKCPEHPCTCSTGPSPRPHETHDTASDEGWVEG